MEETIAAKARWWRRVETWVGLMLLVLGGLVLWDRWGLCRQFFFVYFDQDQSLLWYAAREFLHGRFHEPAFYGQDYNTCIESYLAAPLLLCGAPYWVALPLVTVVLGLLPFYLMAWWAWRRKQWVAAGLSLLVPLVLPVTYAMVTGIPRGFVPGLALGIIPAIWILSEHPAKGEKKGRWFGWKFFVMAIMGVVSLVLTANVGLLLIPAFIYAMFRYFLRVGFWTGTIVGGAIGSLYPLYVYYFYHVWHDDYVIQSRGYTYEVGWKYFTYYMAHAPEVFRDLAPMGVAPTSAIWWILAAAVAVLLYVTLRLRWTLIIGVLITAGVMLRCCGWTRVFYGSSSVFYPYSRFFLAVPVVMVWAVVAAGPMKWKGWKWPSVVTVGLMMFAGVYLLIIRQSALPRTIEAAIEENNDGRSPLYAMTVPELQRIAKGIQNAADKSHATMVLFGGEEYRKLDYALPLMTSCETLFTRFERRTWRMYEENHPRYQKILTLDTQVEMAADSNNYNVALIVNRGGPVVYVVDTNGDSVVAMSRKMQLPLRQFDETK